jgi:hypothetical protein
MRFKLWVKAASVPEDTFVSAFEENPVVSKSHGYLLLFSLFILLLQWIGFIMLCLFHEYFSSL